MPPRLQKTRTPHGARRRQIVDTTIEILMEDGLVTTGGVTERIGIVQSGFYAHFPSIEACLEEAAANARNRIREPVRDGILRLQETEPGNIRLLTEFYEDLLARSIEVAPFILLFLRRKGDLTPVGRILREFEADLLTDLNAHLDTLGFGKKGSEHLALLSKLILAQSFTAIEAWLECGPESLDDPDVPIDGRALAGVLARMNAHLGIAAEDSGFS